MSDIPHWGQLTAIDLFGCENECLIDKEYLSKFPKALCKVIKMTPHGSTIVDKFGEGDLHGLSAMQFIETSSITVHLDDKNGRAFIDIFSCKPFDSKKAIKFTSEYFKASRIKSKTIMRG